MTALPPGWVTCTLDDIKAPGPHAIAGGPFGSDLGRADYVSHMPDTPAVPVIRGSNLGAGEARFYTDDLVFIAAAKADQLARHSALPGDVVVTQRGTLEQVGLVPAGTPWPRFILSQSQMKITVDPTRADPEYIYYWLLTPEIRDYVERHTIASGVPHTNLALFRQTPVRLPPLPQQRAIARALGILDARAALAQAMNDALDRLVRLLFRTWFIEHAPTDSRARGELHGSTSFGESALFPATRAAPGPLGPLPTGWRAVPLTTCASFQNGTPFTGEDFGPAGRGKPVIKIGEIKRGITDQTRWAEDPPGARALDDGDLLMSWSGNPHTSIGTFIWHGGPAWLNQHIFKVVPPAPRWRAFTYCLLRELQPRFVQLARSRQTTGLGHVSQKDMQTLIVPRPSEALAEAFERRTAPAFARIAAHGQLQRTLARARAALLVKLTTGELPATRLP
ncbi:MAG TPA: restriction endonuclease subunit S [Nannocystis sp.]|jgi:type I restriction enzyme S subunit